MKFDIDRTRMISVKRIIYMMERFEPADRTKWPYAAILSYTGKPSGERHGVYEDVLVFEATSKDVSKGEKISKILNTAFVNFG